MYEYLGYLYHNKGVARPNMSHYLELHYFMDFLSFLKARGVDKGGHTKATHAAIRVVSWLKSQPNLDKAHTRQVLKHLTSLATQLGSNMVPKPKTREPDTLKGENRWMDAPPLMAKVEAVRLQALAQAKAMHAGSVPRLQAAKAMHNALLATMCFGYMPPLRHNSILLTLTAPPHSGCTHQDC